MSVPRVGPHPLTPFAGSVNVHYALWFEVPQTTTAKSCGTGTAVDGMSLRDLMHCAVASRHLEPVPRLALVPRLHQVAREARQHVFDPPSLAMIEAFTAMALWASTGEHKTRLVTATAINMAAMLRLEHAAAEMQHWLCTTPPVSSTPLPTRLCSVLQNTKSTS